MKTTRIIIKIAIAVVAVAGVVFLVATYGDRIAAWAKKTLRRLKKDEVCFYSTEDEECDLDEIFEEDDLTSFDGDIED